MARVADPFWGQLRTWLRHMERDGGPGGQARIGWFFAAGPDWEGEPANREPAKHSELAWIDPAGPPGDLVAYTWAGLRAWQAGAPYAIHFQERGSPVGYEPGYEHELTLLGRSW